MTGVLLTTEAVVVVLLVLVLLSACVVLARRRLIARDSELTLSSLRLDTDTRWRSGLLRMSDSTLEWYPLFGLLPRKAHVWPRGALDISEVREVPSPLSPTRRAMRMSFRTTCDLHAVEGVELVVQADAYTGLRAWLESSPPMHPQGED